MIRSARQTPSSPFTAAAEPLAWVERWEQGQRGDARDLAALLRRALASWALPDWIGGDSADEDLRANRPIALLTPPTAGARHLARVEQPAARRMVDPALGLAISAAGHLALASRPGHLDLDAA